VRSARPAEYTKPELLAIRPNEVWSWDISKLKGPAKWTCFHLYVILDIVSRYVVGWMITHRETAELAEQLIADTIDKQNIVPGTLTLHADRGTSMRSKSVAQLLVELDVTKTHSRPHVSDDNPYSEAQFKTLKYRPDFPARFGSIEDARAHCQECIRDCGFIVDDEDLFLQSGVAPWGAIDFTLNRFVPSSNPVLA
jgi:putative transposase